MENENFNIEQELNAPHDISHEFSTMDHNEFNAYVKSLKDLKELSITIDWTNKFDARRLKAFIEMARDGQKRVVSIRATKEQKNEEPNVFTSGVEWIEIPT